MQWVPVHLVQDSPEKINKDAKRSEHLTFQLQNLVGKPQKQLDIISAYFVPADTGTESLINLNARVCGCGCSPIPMLPMTWV